MEATSRGRLVGFVAATYLLFWLFLGVIGATMAFGAPAPVVTILKNVSSWTPTFVVLLLFRWLYPGAGFGAYLKRAFASPVSILTFVLILAVQFAIALGAVGAHAVAGGTVTFMSLSALPAALLLNVTSGPGEELGWRGYLLNGLLQRRRPVAAALIVGVVWGFWHTPLWFLTGYAGGHLLLYIGCFLVTIVSFSVVITVFYGRSRNILVAMWIHFLFNLLLRLAHIDILHVLAYNAVGYLVFALVLLVADRAWLFARPADHPATDRVPRRRAGVRGRLA